MVAHVCNTLHMQTGTWHNQLSILAHAKCLYQQAAPTSVCVQASQQTTRRITVLHKGYHVLSLQCCVLCRFDYANKAALGLMEASWEELVGKPSNTVPEHAQASCLSTFRWSICYDCTMHVPWLRRMLHAACYTALDKQSACFSRLPSS